MKIVDEPTSGGARRTSIDDEFVGAAAALGLGLGLGGRLLLALARARAQPLQIRVQLHQHNNRNGGDDAGKSGQRCRRRNGVREREHPASGCKSSRRGEGVVVKDERAEKQRKGNASQEVKAR